MSVRKKYRPFARAPHMLRPSMYMAPALIALFISASALYAYQTSLVSGYMSMVNAAGQIQGDSYRATASAALYLWSNGSEWMSELGQKADYMKGVYITVEK